MGSKVGGGGYSKAKKQGSGGSGRYFLIGLVVLLVLGAIALFVARSPIVGERQQASCALLIDRSDSAIDNHDANAYENVALRTVDGCRKRKATLTVFWFDQRSDKVVVANGTPYRLWAPRSHNKATGNSLAGDQVDDAKTIIRGIYDHLPASPKRRTDLLTAVSSVAKYLYQESTDAGTGGSAFLVAVTDGLQVSDPVSVESLSKGATPKELVDQTQRLGLVPNLSGIDFDMFGVNGGVAQSGSTLTAAFVEQVHQFWVAMSSAGHSKSLCYLPPPATTNPASGPC